MKSFLTIYILYYQYQQGFADTDKALALENDGQQNDGNYHMEEAKAEKYPYNYEKEIEAGKVSDLFSSNHHNYVPSIYTEYSRRFVPFYKYVEKNQSKMPRADANELNVLLQLDAAIKEALQDRTITEVNEINSQDEVIGGIIPKKASPEEVLDVAEKFAVLDASKSDNPTDYVAVKDALRTGNYWNGLWKEDLPNPEISLRSNQDSVRVKILPGSKLHQIASVASKISPKLLYVIKKRDF